MPKITVDHNSTLPISDATDKIRIFFESDPDLKKLDPKINFQFDEKTGKGKIQGSKFKADLSVRSEGSGSLIQVVVDLPLLLTPFKGKVEETLQKKLKKYLA